MKKVIFAALLVILLAVSCTQYRLIHIVDNDKEDGSSNSVQSFVDNFAPEYFLADGLASALVNDGSSTTAKLINSAFESVDSLGIVVRSENTEESLNGKLSLVVEYTDYPFNQEYKVSGKIKYIFTVEDNEIFDCSGSTNDSLTVSSDSGASHELGLEFVNIYAEGTVVGADSELQYENISIGYPNPNDISVTVDDKTKVSIKYEVIAEPVPFLITGSKDTVSVMMIVPRDGVNTPVDPTDDPYSSLSYMMYTVYCPAVAGFSSEISPDVDEDAKLFVYQIDLKRTKYKDGKYKFKGKNDNVYLEIEYDPAEKIYTFLQVVKEYGADFGAPENQNYYIVSKSNVLSTEDGGIEYDANLNAWRGSVTTYAWMENTNESEKTYRLLSIAEGDYYSDDTSAGVLLKRIRTWDPSKDGLVDVQNPQPNSGNAKNLVAKADDASGTVVNAYQLIYRMNNDMAYIVSDPKPDLDEAIGDLQDNNSVWFNAIKSE